MSSLVTLINVSVAVFFIIFYLNSRNTAPSTTQFTYLKAVASNSSDNEPQDGEVIWFKDVGVKFRIITFPSALSAALCGNLTLLALVQSAPANAAARKFIRESWASKAAVKSIASGAARVVFLLGTGENISTSLQSEINQYQDMILVDFEDRYDTLVYKTAISLHLSHSRCHTPFLLKVDEDVVFHIDRFMKNIGPVFKPDGMRIYCKVWKGVKIRRDRDKDWFVSDRQFSDANYPAYCGGPSYVLTAPAVQSLLRALPAFNVVSVEDAFITGIVAQRAHVERIGLENRFRTQYQLLKHNAKDCPGPLLSVHNLKTMREVRETWRYLSRNC